MGMTRALRHILIAIVAAALWGATAVEAAQISERRVRDAIGDATSGLGQSIAGGSALTGAAGATGGLGMFRIGASVGTTRVEIADPAAVSGDIGFQAPAGVLNAAVGVWAGPTFGAFDVLGRVGVVSVGDEFDTGVGLVSLGGRIEIVRESLVAPAVSVTLYKTWLPDLGFDDLDAEVVAFETDIDVLSLRLDASKRFLLATPYAGAGIDRTQLDARYRIPASLSTAEIVIDGEIETSETHAKAYLGLEIGPAPFGLTLEGGRYRAGWFGFVGMRIGTS